MNVAVTKALCLHLGGAKVEDALERKKTRVKVHWQKEAGYEELELEPTLRTGSDTRFLQVGSQRRKLNRNKHKSLYLKDGREHAVWKPTSHTIRRPNSGACNDVAKEVMKQRRDLHERQQALLSQVQATQDVLRRSLFPGTSESEKQDEGEEGEEEEEVEVGVGGEGENEEIREAQETDTTETETGIWYHTDKKGAKGSQHGVTEQSNLSLHLEAVVRQFAFAMSQSSEPQPTTAHNQRSHVLQQ